MATKTQVTVLGGGFAGLETAFLLKHRLHDAVDITLVSDEPDFLFRPNTIYIPFGLDADDLRIPLSMPAARQNIDLRQGRVEGIDTGAGRVQLGNGTVPYDYLVVATGASMRPSEIPGLEEYANTIWTPDQMSELGKELRRIVERGKSGKVSRIVFLVPPNNKCSGPLYEMVFMVETHLRREGVRDSVEIVWTTSEHNFIQAFGPKIHDVVVEEFEERKIGGHLEWVVDHIDPDAVHYENGESLEYDLLIAFPPYVSSVMYDSLPTDDRGFISTDFANRQVVGMDRIYAPGDAGDFPVKQAFLAFLQADAVAEDIVGRATQRDPRVDFDPVSMCVMEQLDKAVFAQVPLELTGNPLSPVAVRAADDGDYKVGVSKTWRIGKKVLGVYLPMRFRAGEPFHAGAAWKMMESGLGMMSGVLAH